MNFSRRRAAAAAFCLFAGSVVIAAAHFGSEDAHDDGDPLGGRFSPEQTQDGLRNILTKYVDIDHDGKINTHDVAAWLHFIQGIGVARHIAEKVNAVDKNKDGLLNLEELLSDMATEDGRDYTEKEAAYLKWRFKVSDVDDDGNLSPTEVFHMMDPRNEHKMAATEARLVIKSSDKNDDSRLDFEEFKGADPILFDTFDNLNADSHTDDFHQVFADLDSNADQFVDDEEMTNAVLPAFEEESFVDYASQILTELFRLVSPIEEDVYDIQSIVNDENVAQQWASSLLLDYGDMIASPEAYVGLEKFPDQDSMDFAERVVEAQLSHEPDFSQFMEMNGERPSGLDGSMDENDYESEDEHDEL